MALKYGTVSPTAIKCNNTDLTVLKYGSTTVWGKPYSLTISAGTNTSVTVTRTSSPNQHASTGTLSSGSVIYYGDVLTISYSVSSGYKISTATINGISFGSGDRFTVTSAVSIVTTAVASVSWKTVFSGSKVQSFTANSDPNTVSINISGIRANTQTRITATVLFQEDLTAGGWGSGWDSTYYEKTVSINAQTTPTTVSVTLEYGTAYLTVNTPTTANYISVYRSGGDNYQMWVAPSKITITKIEQYY